MITDVYVPSIVVLLMILAGTGVETRQFGIILQSPLALIGGTFAQFLVLPLIALALVKITRPAPDLAAGLVLVAACPGGALSNFYCYLGRLNVSLSVMMTATSNMLSFVALPTMLVITFPPLLNDAAVPTGQLAWRLLLFLFNTDRLGNDRSHSRTKLGKSLRA